MLGCVFHNLHVENIHAFSPPSHQKYGVSIAVIIAKPLVGHVISNKIGLI